MQTFSGPPVKQNQLLEVKISHQGNGGDGVAKVDGFVIFVQGAVFGETHLIRIKRVMPRYAYAEIYKDKE